MQTWEQSLKDTSESDQDKSLDSLEKEVLSEQPQLAEFFEKLDGFNRDELIEVAKSLATKGTMFVEMMTALADALHAVVNCDECKGAGQIVNVGGRNLHDVLSTDGTKGGIAFTEEVADKLNAITDRLQAGEITEAEAKRLAGVDHHECKCRTEAMRVLLLYMKFGMTVITSHNDNDN